MNVSALAPYSVPRAFSSRSISPVERCDQSGFPSAANAAWVPFHAPEDRRKFRPLYAAAAEGMICQPAGGTAAEGEREYGASLASGLRFVGGSKR